MSVTKRLIFSCFAIALGLLLGGLALELVFGDWLIHDPWRATRKLNLIRDRHFTYDVSQIAGHPDKQVLYTRDTFGLRGKCAPELVSIVTLGGSTTDQRLIGDDWTWQEGVARLASSRLGQSICIANAGVDGHSTFGHIAAMESWLPLIPKLKPKAVFLYIGINDVGRMEPQKGFDNVQRPNEHPLYWSLREKSALWSIASTLDDLRLSWNPVLPYAGHQKRPPDDAEYSESELTPGIAALADVNAQLFKSRLNTLTQQIRKLGAVPVCISQPHLYQRRIRDTWRGLRHAFEFQGQIFNGLDYQHSMSRLNAEMKSICSQYGAYYADMASKDFSASDFYDVMHMTPSGAQKLALQLFKDLEQQGFFHEVYAK